MGIRGKVSRNTLAHANQVRDWRIYADFAQILIGRARRLYANDSFGVELNQTAYALDSTLIDLCLSLFPWAKFRKHKGAIKLHTLLDLRGSIPSLVIITHGKIHDVTILDQLIFEPGAFYIVDRGYLDFARLYVIHQSSAFFVTRAKSNFSFKRLYSRPVDKSTGVQCDQKQTLGLLNQQLYATCVDHRPTFSVSLANRALLQMDQTTSSNQSLLWYNRERRQNTDMDCHHRLCVGGNRQKTFEARPESLHNSTDFKYLAFRKNPDFRGFGRC
jgi:hypothetical protein